MEDLEGFANREPIVGDDDYGHGPEVLEAKVVDDGAFMRSMIRLWKAKALTVCRTNHIFDLL